jgi:hypothetical protein
MELRTRGRNAGAGKNYDLCTGAGDFQGLFSLFGSIALRALLQIQELR